MNCEFSNPTIFDGSPATNTTDFWNYKTAICQDTGVIQITNGSSTFWLDQKISTGDLFITFFLTVFVMFFVFDFLYRFIFKIKVNFRH
jgi:hypothetical protein